MIVLMAMQDIDEMIKPRMKKTTLFYALFPWTTAVRWDPPAPVVA
jgi:hypothetical protein